MLKLTFYVALMLIAIVATLLSPFAGAVSSLEAYLLNPDALAVNVQVHYQLWVTIAFLLSYALRRPSGLRPCGNESFVLKSLWLFVAIAGLSALWAVVSPGDALDSAYDILKTTIVATLLVRAVETERQLSILVAGSLIGIWHASALHVLGPRIGYLPTADIRLATVLPDPISAVLVLYLPTVFLVAMMGRGWERILAWCAVPFVLDSFVSTYERSAFVGLVVQIAAMIFILPRKILWRAMPVLILGGSLLIFRLAPSDYWTRVETILHPTEEASANSRFVINHASWRMFFDHPMGVGYRNYPEVSPTYLPGQYLTDGKRSAHNSYLTVLCETGICGFLAWATAFFGSAYLLRKIRKRADLQRLRSFEVYAMGMELGLYGWLAQSWTQAFHEADPAFWFLALSVVITRMQLSAPAPPEAADEEPTKAPCEPVTA